MRCRRVPGRSRYLDDSALVLFAKIIVIGSDNNVGMILRILAKMGGHAVRLAPESHSVLRE